MIVIIATTVYWQRDKMHSAGGLKKHWKIRKIMLERDKRTRDTC